jgi:SAM-dependent methyltransferase
MAQVLDLACGSGEATLVLRELGVQHITGCDPYTGAAYLARTGWIARPDSFEDIATGSLSDQQFSLIVCSYALHLVVASWLPGVAVALAQLAPALLILTPHKRPLLKPEWGWHLQAELYLQRVRARYYVSG